MKSEVVNTAKLIVNLFSQEELSLLEDTYTSGSIWTFKDQIIDRYSGFYISFNSWNEIKDDIEERIFVLKKALNNETKDAVRELLLDELDSKVFVSYQTYLWNQEMINNTEKSSNALVIWAVERIVNELEENFNDKETIRKALLLRWKKAWFVASRKEFKNFLAYLKVMKDNDKKIFNHLDFQEFLVQADEYFLYPKKDRFFKWLINRNENGGTLGWKKRIDYLTRCVGLWNTIFIFLSLFIVLVLLCIFMTI